MKNVSEVFGGDKPGFSITWLLPVPPYFPSSVRSTFFGFIIPPPEEEEMDSLENADGECTSSPNPAAEDVGEGQSGESMDGVERGAGLLDQRSSAQEREENSRAEEVDMDMIKKSPPVQRSEAAGEPVQAIASAARGRPLKRKPQKAAQAMQL
jgi:hypothetical protein